MTDKIIKFVPQNEDQKQSMEMLEKQVADYNINNVEPVEICEPVSDSGAAVKAMTYTDTNNCSQPPQTGLILELGRFQLYTTGLWGWVKSKNEKDSGNFERIGNYILAVGKTNLDNVSCLLLEFTDNNNNRIDFMLERGELADSRGLIKRLLNAGYGMDLHYARQLQTYLNEYQPESEVIATKQTGWVGDSYVLPDRIIGSNQNIRYYGQINNDRFIQTGTTEEWRDNVAKHCQGFDILELSLYAGFSSLLMPFVDFGFGLHLHGKSSGGKTTALRVASSIFGNPKSYISKWNSTHNGMEFYGYNSNHALCALDEVNEAAKTTLDSIYMLIDGRGKTRAISRIGGVEQAKPKTWQTVALSTGEVSIEDLALQYSKNLNAGETVRMIDIEVNQICQDKAHADLLIENTGKYHGAACIAFIEYIQANNINIDAKYKAAYQELINQHPDLHSQASRVAKYFALMAVAGNIAISAGILPDSFKPRYYAYNQFARWYKNNATDRETKEIISALIMAVDDRANWFTDNQTNFEVRIPNKIGVYDGFDYFLISTLAANKLYKLKHFTKPREVLARHKIIPQTRVKVRDKATNTPVNMYKIDTYNLDKFRDDKEE